MDYYHHNNNHTVVPIPPPSEPTPNPYLQQHHGYNQPPQQSHSGIYRKSIVLLLSSIVTMGCLLTSYALNASNNAIVVKKTSMQNMLELVAHSLHCELDGTTCTESKDDEHCDLDKLLQFTKGLTIGIGKELKNFLDFKNKKLKLPSSDTVSSKVELHFGMKQFVIKHDELVVQKAKFSDYPLSGTGFFRISQSVLVLLAAVLLGFAALLLVIAVVTESSIWHYFGLGAYAISGIITKIVVTATTLLYTFQDDIHTEYYEKLSKLHHLQSSARDTFCKHNTIQIKIKRKTYI